MLKNEKHILLSPFKITLIYVIVAGLWITFTDQFLNNLVSDSQYLSTLQTYKGWFYVIVTGAGLWGLIKFHDRQLLSQKEKLTTVLGELHSEKELTQILFDRIPVLITVYDPDLEEFEVNREFEEVIGWTNEEIQKHDIDLLEQCYPDLETQEEVVAFMNNPGIGWKEFPMMTKSGKEIPTSWTNVRLTDNTSVGIGIDMTEIKASQAKIRESRELLKKTFESLAESVIIVNPDDRTIVDCNKGTEKIFGYSSEELIGESTKKLHVNQEAYEKFDQIGGEVLEKDGIFKTEFKMQKKDGTVFFSDHTVTLVYDEDGKIDKVVSVIRDITEQKKYQTKLEERNTFIETTLENLPIGVAVNTIDDGKVTIMNKQFEEIYGWSREILKDVDSFFEHVYPDDEFRQKIKNQVMQDIKSGQPERMHWKGIPITTQEGKEKLVNNKTIPLYDQNLMISTVIDVTEQKRLEQKLRESEKKYRHLFEKNPEPMWIYNPNTLGFVEVNQAAINHYGYSEEEFLNMSLADIRPPEDVEAMKEDVKQHRGKSSYSEEWTHLKKDGSKIVVKVSASDIQYEEDTTYRLVLINDITKQKRMQEKIIQSIIEGEDRERKRIAHELHDGLGQYLVAANMNFQSVEKQTDQLPEKRKQQFQTGLSLLKDALSETRSIAHNLMPKAISDYGLIAALQNLLRDLKESTDINFKFQCNCEDLRLTNKAEVNIYRILQEAISNAVRHAECSAIRIRLIRDGPKLQIEINDDGKGIDSEPQNDDHGLGLKSIRNRVNSLNGTMNLESEPGKGLKIDITIPNLENLLSTNGDA